MHWNFDPLVNDSIDSFRVLNVLDHDFTTLQTDLAESIFEDFDISNLLIKSVAANPSDRKRTDLATDRIISNTDKVLRQSNLKLLDKNFF